MFSEDKFISDAELERLRVRNEQALAEAKQKLGDKWLLSKKNHVGRKDGVSYSTTRPKKVALKSVRTV
jgi:hypothetical protein